jgi:hypothetical protein
VFAYKKMEKYGKVEREDRERKIKNKYILEF